jgi:hypothetical protein
MPSLVSALPCHHQRVHGFVSFMTSGHPGSFGFSVSHDIRLVSNKEKTIADQQERIFL